MSNKSANDFMQNKGMKNLLKLNSVVSVRKRTMPTERPYPVGEVSANFSW
jgi:hypothetical protein